VEDVDVVAKRVISVILISFLLVFNTKGINAQETNLVKSNQIYTYEVMTKDLLNLSEKYSEIIEVKEIGKSEYGKAIWAVKLGKGEANVFFNGAHHAREWLTTTMLVKMIEEYAKAYTDNQPFGGYNVKVLLENTSIWFVPMVNPDGVTIQQGNLNSFPKVVQDNLIKINGGSKNFKAWKADARGIDPNRQYPANWDKLTGGAKAPAKYDYKGTKPLMTKETSTLVNFTNEINPEITVSYHSSGRIIYWHFNNKAENMTRDKKIADKLSSITGYPLVNPSTSVVGGGYKDWFIQTYNRPGFTIEIGRHVGNTNLPLSAFEEEWKLNKNVGVYIANEGYKLWDARFQIELQNTLKYIKEEEAKLLNLEKRDLMDFSRLAELYKKAKFNDITLFINGQKVVFETAKPIRKENNIMIPLDGLINHLNLKMELNNETKEAVLYKDSKIIRIISDQSIVYIDNNPVSVDGITFLVDKIMIPESFLSVVLGIELQHDESGQITFIEN
jgi:g-D-glutamyl-meso-diaminopimelate peptidase